MLTRAMQLIGDEILCLEPGSFFQAWRPKTDHVRLHIELGLGLYIFMGTTMHRSTNKFLAISAFTSTLTFWHGGSIVSL